MKKAYTKPEIAYESFMMSTNIAGDCEGATPSNYSNYNSCALLVSGVFVFLDSLTGCNKESDYIQIGDLDQYNGYCYHTPTETTNIFNS